MTALCEVCGRVRLAHQWARHDAGLCTAGFPMGSDEECLQLALTRALAERDEARGAAEEHASKAAADRKLADEWMNARIRDRQWSARWKRAAKAAVRNHRAVGRLLRGTQTHAAGHPHPTPSKEGA